MGYIPDDIVERIKAESDILSVVSGFVTLKKAGKDYRGICPFHQEKTPSFYVIPAKGFYHCFGCGAGGNAVNFIMAHERLDYPEALRFLAEKAGITIPETTSARKSDFEALYEALALAGSYYAKSLRDGSGNGAHEYLRSRGIADEIMRTFSIGYAPPGWDGFVKHASSKGIATAILERVGLAIKKESYYDRFRNRLMVPIKTVSGRIVGFGGRVLPGDDGPKYINSPETEVYKKGKILFGLDISRDYIREENLAIVVEGYFDLIALHQYGIKNVVAVSGTGFTPDQAQLLARFCEQIVLLYDSDSAGIKAAFRACGVLYDSGVEPRLVRLPKGHDPDSFVREHGSKALSTLITGGVDVIDFVCGGIQGRFSDQSLARQAKIIQGLAESARLIRDPLRRNLLIKKISQKFDLAVGTIESQIQPLPQAGKTEPREKPIGREKPEREFLAFLLSHPDLIEQCHGVVESALFIDQNNARLFEMMIALNDLGRPVVLSGIFDRLDDEGLRRRLAEIAVIEPTNGDDAVHFQEYIRAFKTIAFKKRKEELKSQLSEAESLAQEERVQQLTRELRDLQTRGGYE
jgi:DNA primase